MAIIPKSIYPGQTVGSDSSYPHGKARNDSSPTSTDGTPLEENWVNDLWGFLQGLLGIASITPSGTPDNVTVSQYRGAIQWMIDESLDAFGDESATDGGVIYVDRYASATGYGTGSKPFQTLDEALSRINDGDADSNWLVNIGPGSYSVNAVLPAARRITLRGASCKSNHRTLFSGAATLGWSPTGVGDTIEFQNIDWGGELNVGGTSNWTAYFRNCNVPYVDNTVDYIGSLHLAGPMLGTKATTSYPMCTFEGTQGTYAANVNLYATGIRFVRDFTVDQLHLHGCDVAAGAGTVAITIGTNSSVFNCTKSSGTWNLQGDAPFTPLTLDAMSNYFADSITNITKTLAHSES